MYSSLFIYSERTVFLHAITSRSDSFSRVSQRVLLDGAGHLKKTADETDETLWECFVAAGNATRLLSSQFFSYLRAHLVNDCLYIAKEENLPRRVLGKQI